jgi:hypothetical protein
MVHPIFFLKKKSKNGLILNGISFIIKLQVEQNSVQGESKMVNVNMDKVMEVAQIFSKLEKEELLKLLASAVQAVENNPNDQACHEIRLAVLEAMAMKQK